jgi:transposase
VVSLGQVLKAMILNGLGFLSAPLYLFSEFFEGKAIEHLLGDGIAASHLNDDRLGRALAWIIHKREEKKEKESVKRFRIRLSRIFVHLFCHDRV